MSCREFEHRLGADLPGQPVLVEHLLACRDCRDLMLATRMLQDPGKTGAAEPAGGQACPEPDDITSLVFGLQVSAKQGPLIEHLSACSTCYSRLVHQLRDLDTLEGIEPEAPHMDLERQAILVGEQVISDNHRRSRFNILDPTLFRWAAAAIAIVGILFVGGGLILRQDPALRGSTTDQQVTRGEIAVAPSPVSPLGVVSMTDNLRFVWEPPVDPAVATIRPRYRLLVIDFQTGTTLIERTTEESFLDLSAEEFSRLEPQRHYHWIVEPLSQGAGEPSEAVTFWLDR